MRYCVNGMEIRTENAAKPISRASTWLVKYLMEGPPRGVSVDFGCGKLRYTGALAKVSKIVHVIDSARQVTRRQVIDGFVTTIPDYVASAYSNVVVHTVESESWRTITADFVLCANVLSGIPFEPARISVLRDLAAICKPSGEILIVTQYANSYFRAYEHRDDAIGVGDGFLIPASASYFCCLTKGKLASYCTQAGLAASRAWVEGQSAVVLASPSSD